MQLPLPLILGHEPVGEIVELGAGVTDLKVGDRVGVSWVQKGCGRCPYCQKQKALYCTGFAAGPKTWIQMGGGLSEFMVAWAEGCTLLPNGLSYELAAPLFCAGYTIASGYANAKAKGGEKIAVLGLGGLGHLAVQYAKAKGHQVIVLTHSEDKQQLAKQLGADEVIVAKGHIGKSLKQAGGVDVILNTGNSTKLAVESLEGLLPEGRLVYMSVEPEPMNIPPYLMISKQLQVIGSKQSNREDLVNILELTAQGKVKPLTEIYSLNEVNQVLDRLIQGKIHLRAVLKPNFNEKL